MCPSFPPRMIAGTGPEQVLQRETLSSQRPLCQHQERLGFHQPKVRITSRFICEFRQKMGYSMVVSPNPKATKFFNTGRTCLQVCWTSTTKDRESWQVSTPWNSRSARQVNIALTPKHKHPPLRCFHILEIHLETDVFSFLGRVILSLCQMLSVTSLRELLRPLAWLSMSHEELHKQPTAVLAYGSHHSAPQTS